MCHTSEVEPCRLVFRHNYGISTGVFENSNWPLTVHQSLFKPMRAVGKHFILLFSFSPPLHKMQVCEMSVGRLSSLEYNLVTQIWRQETMWAVVNFHAFITVQTTKSHFWVRDERWRISHGLATKENAGLKEEGQELQLHRKVHSKLAWQVSADLLI